MSTKIKINDILELRDLLDAIYYEGKTQIQLAQWALSLGT